MKYMGSKNRLSKEIVPIIQKKINENNSKLYIEPFVGGANIIDKIKCEKKIGTDINRYLIALLIKARDNPEALPTLVTEKEYKSVKSNFDNYEDWYVGFVGFNCSFGSKWFGGYARGKNSKGVSRNYAQESYNNMGKQSPNLKGIEFNVSSFGDIGEPEGAIIYCDPPYKDTTKYGSGEFPYEEYYKWCKKMSEKNIVLCSEYSMPSEFECIWEKETIVNFDSQRKNRGGDNSRTEKLFILR